MFETARLPLIQTAPRQIGHSDADGFRHLPKIAGVGAAYVLQSDGNGGSFWGPVSGASVASVFGRTGAVLAVAGDYDAFYYTKAQTTDIVNTRPALHRWPIDINHGYAFTRSYNSTTRQPTFTPIGSSFHAWMHATKVEFATAQTLPAHPNVTGLYYYYLDTDLAFKYSATVWNLLSVVPCVIIIYDAAKGVGKMYHELHTTEMTGLEHEEQHTTVGTKLVDGGAILSGYTFGVDSDAAVTFAASACTLWDEDIRHLIPQLNDNGPYEIWYRSGASGAWTWDDPAAKPYKIGATYITYNKLVSITWQQVEATGGGLGSYVNIYVIPVPCDNGPQWMFVQGQNEFTTQAAAEAESWKSLALDGFPVQEFVSVRRVTYWARSTHTGVAGRVKMVSITDVETTRGGSSGSPTIHNALAGREDANCHGFPAIGGTLLASQFPALSGDVSTVAGSLTATLANIVIAGTAGSASVVPIPTWDTKGRITSVTTATITPAAIGAIPAPGSAGNYSQFLRGDGAWSNTLFGSGASFAVHVAVTSCDSGNNWVNHNAAVAAWGHAFQSNGANLLTLMPAGAAFASLTAGGIVKADPSTGMLKIATSGDLPFLPASGGTTNRLPKWTSGTAQGLSIASDNGTTFSVAGSLSSDASVSLAQVSYGNYAVIRSNWASSGNFGIGPNGTDIVRVGRCVSGTDATWTGPGINFQVDGSFSSTALTSGGIVKASATTGLLVLASSSDITAAITSPAFTGGAGFDFLTSTAMSSALIRIGDGSSTHAVSFPKVATKSFSVAGTADFASMTASGTITAGRVAMTQTGFAITDAISVPDAGADKSWTFNCETVLNKVKSFTFNGDGNFDISGAPLQKLRSIVVTGGAYELPIVNQGESVEILFNVAACDVSSNSTQSITALGLLYAASSAVGTYGHGSGSNKRSAIKLMGVSNTRASIIA